MKTNKKKKTAKRRPLINFKAYAVVVTSGNGDKFIRCRDGYVKWIRPEFSELDIIAHGMFLKSKEDAKTFFDCSIEMVKHYCSCSVDGSYKAEVVPVNFTIG